MGNEQGFTLIELIVVIVILGILAAIAVPKYVDLSDAAGKAALKSTAGALSAASAINFAANKADATKGSNVKSCTDVAGLIDQGLDSKYTISDPSGAFGSTSVPGTCYVTDSTMTAPDNSAPFSAYYVSTK